MKVQFKGWLTVLALGLAALVMITLATQPAHAGGPWYVAPDGNDSNDCLSPGPTHACATINGALGKADPGDTIYVATGTYTSTVSEVVLLDKNATLSGGWDGTFTTQSGTSTIDGEEARRGITVNSGVTATVERFTVQNGAAGDGGGIGNSGTLALNNSTVSGNTADDKGGGIRNADGTLTLNHSTVSGNTAGSYGGGIDNSNGTLVLNNSTVSDNTVGPGHSGGGIYNWGISTLTLNNSTVSGNTAGGSGGGISGGAVILNNSTVSSNTAENGAGISGGDLTLNNSTVSGNTASEKGGGIHKGSGYGTMTLNSSTVSGNTARAYGGGIYVYGGTVTLQNTILAGNTAGSGSDCSGLVAIGSAGYNLIGDTSGCTFTPAASDLINVNANLGQLIGAPGAPRYYPLLAGSPAIDAVPLGQCTVATDQRGAARPQGPACDIGAYEYATPGPATSISAIEGTPQRTPPFSAFEMSFQALVLDSISTSVNNATVTFSAPASGASGTFADSGTFTTTAVTDENGIATAATFAANGLEGSYTVTATVGGVVTPANFLLTNFGWYVAPGGNNANDCQTAATPCATVNGVLGKASFTAGDTVLVVAGTHTGAGSEVVLLDKSVRLLGGWDGSFTTQSGISTIDGEGARRGITVNSVLTAIVERFTVQNGSDLGGIYNNQGTLTLSNSTVSGNSGGGIYNSGTVTLNSSTVSNNTGGISNSGTVTLNNSAVSNNTGLGIRNDGIMILNNSTVSSNTATGISNYNGFLVLNNSTVSSNMAQNGAGISNNGFLVLNNCTVSNNTANGYGGGIRNWGGSTTLQNTILAGNTATTGNAPDCEGTIGSSGYNLIGDTSGCTFSPSTGDFLNIDAKLSSLIDSPGYHPLLPGSPAIDAGNPAGCTEHLGNPLDTDQRGVPRVGRCDMGSYEFDPANNPLTGVFLPIITRNY